MSKPRRRRFAANRESPYQAQVHDDDGRGVYVPDTPDLPADPNAPADPADDFTAGEPGSYQTLPPAFRPSHTRRRLLLDRRRRSAIRVGLLFSVLGLLVGYALPHRQVIRVRTVAPTTPDVPSLTPADQSALDAAYAARAAGNFQDAEARFLALGQTHPTWKSMLVEIGRTRLYHRQFNDAATVLRQAIAGGLAPAEANAVLGALYKAQQSYSAADECFAQAVALEPTEPVYYFFRGECLREQGKVLEATAQYRSALLRNQYETAAPLYRVKLWLSEIESDQAKANNLDASLDEALKRPDPPMEVLFAAAARDLKANDINAAFRRILLARQHTDLGVFQVVINDPVFAPIRKRPDLVKRLLFVSPPVAPLPAGVYPDVVPSASFSTDNPFAAPMLNPLLAAPPAASPVASPADAASPAGTPSAPPPSPAATSPHDP